jgi:2-polyprenyl-3-methyl-5-hydroxy-6-metoxy-1,4-benzoquinol methylase
MDSVNPHWYKDESFWRFGFPFMFPESSFERAKVQVGQGPGRFAIPFAQQGFKVTGVDSTPFLLTKAREYATRESAEVEWVESDMRQFSRAGAFDLVLNMQTSFGYFDDPAENLLVLKNVYDSLKQGGVFVLETIGKEILARIFEATGSTEIEGVGLSIQRRKAIDDWSRMENEWILIRDGETKIYRLRHWIYSAREFRLMLESVGFQTVDYYGDLQGMPYGPTATILLAIAQKA